MNLPDGFVLGNPKPPSQKTRFRSLDAALAHVGGWSTEAVAEIHGIADGLPVRHIFIHSLDPSTVRLELVDGRLVRILGWAVIGEIGIADTQIRLELTNRRARGRPRRVPGTRDGWCLLMRMTVEPAESGDITLGHLLAAAGVNELSQILAIRHTSKLLGGDFSADSVFANTRAKTVKTNILPKDPPPIWLVFTADGAQGARARFFGAYANAGELTDQRTDSTRYFDLSPSPLLASMKNRLVVDWGAGAIGWAKQAANAAKLPVLEIADPTMVLFPGYGGVLLTHAELRAVTAEPWYAEWRSALSQVNAIYAISDASDGKLYIGKADGAKGLYGRWEQYAQDGHGGNKSLKELGVKDPKHREHFVFSILRVFDPHAAWGTVNAAEEHFKKALLTKEFGLNN